MNAHAKLNDNKPNDEQNMVLTLLRKVKTHISKNLPGVYPKGYDWDDAKWPVAWDFSNVIYVYGGGEANADTRICDLADDLLENQFPKEVDMGEWCSSVKKKEALELLNTVIQSLEKQLALSSAKSV
jgi:hypothetical protein